MVRTRFLTHVLAGSLLLLLPAIVHAEVIYQKSGRILIGDIIGATPGGVSYTVFGQTVELTVESIQKTEKTLDLLSTLSVELTLKDGSVIRGKIVDFDVDIGLFLDISFGTLTIPVQAIQSIDDTELKRRITPASVQVFVGGGLQQPFLGSEKYFGPGWYSHAGFSWSLPGLRGWQIGLLVEGLGINYVQTTTSHYQLYSTIPILTYQYLDLRAREGILSLFTPYISVGLGPAYISVTDLTLSDSRAESVTPEAKGMIGLQFNTFRELALKLEGFAAVIWQKKLPYTAGGLCLSVGWEF